jgi:hypothetical protein
MCKSDRLAMSDLWCIGGPVQLVGADQVNTAVRAMGMPAEANPAARVRASKRKPDESTHALDALMH